MARPETRFVRRLVLLVLWLVLLDPFVPSILRSVERRHYEGQEVFRFENSDLFALGPLVSYLRENPRGDRRRFVFFGNSMIFGYGVAPVDSLPAHFEKRRRDTRVLNISFNGSEMGSSYVIGKAIIDSVDSFYVQVIGQSANAMLASLVPVEPSDVQAFHLTVPNPIERRLQSLAGGIWRLYGVNDRLQAAIFGTSTRQFLYLHKKDILLRVLKPFYAPPSSDPKTWPQSDEHITLRGPRSVTPPAGDDWRRNRPKVLLDFAELARAHRKRVVFIEFEYEGSKSDDAGIAPFNAANAPYAEIVVLAIPKPLTYDGMHLTPFGAAEAAEALATHEKEGTQDVQTR